MKTIVVLTDFQHNGTRYFRDEVVKVTPAEAAYFCAASWAQDKDGVLPTGAPNSGVTLLNVANLTIGQSAAEPK